MNKKTGEKETWEKGIYFEEFISHVFSTFSEFSENFQINSRMSNSNNSEKFDQTCPICARTLVQVQDRYNIFSNQMRLDRIHSVETRRKERWCTKGTRSRSANQFRKSFVALLINANTTRSQFAMSNHRSRSNHPAMKISPNQHPS